MILALKLAATVLVPTTLYWLDNRRQTHRNHTENQVRLARIETKLDPIWRWWNQGEK